MRSQSPRVLHRKPESMWRCKGIVSGQQYRFGQSKDSQCVPVVATNFYCIGPSKEKGEQHTQDRNVAAMCPHPA